MNEGRSAATILKGGKASIAMAADILRRGGLVAFPTETVYGLGGHALDAQAVARIFEAKDRPSFDPLIVHVADVSTVDRIAAPCGNAAIKLIDRFWPGPLTLVLPKTTAVPTIVTAGLSTVAVRMPDHPVALELIRVAGLPIAAPSANRFGCLSPTTAAHVYDQLGQRIDFILDGGPCPIGVESTVLDMTEDVPVLLRPGGLSLEEIEAVIGKVLIPGDGSSSPRSPGLLDHHYAPRTSLMILGDDDVPDPSVFQRVGLLAFHQPHVDIAADHIEILSSGADLREAAANLFSALHRLDKNDLDIIYAETLPEIGLGRAIMNRLRKASAAFPLSGPDKKA